MAAFSRSNCSRAATPADDRASTRCTSTNPMRLGAGAWARVLPASAPTVSRPAPARTASAGPIRVFLVLILTLLEGSAHGELELPDALPLLAIQLEAVVYTERAERRVPAQAGPGAVRRPARVEGAAPRHVRAVHLPHVVEDGRPDPEEQRDRVLDRSQDLAVAADPGARAVARGHLAELELAQAVGAAE